MGLFLPCSGEWRGTRILCPENWPLPLSGSLRGQSSPCPEARRGGTPGGHIDEGTSGPCSRHRQCLTVHTQQKVISCSDSVAQVLRVGGLVIHGPAPFTFPLTAPHPSPTGLCHRVHSGSTLASSEMACSRVCNPEATRGLRPSLPSPCQTA